jgi:uncharacterized protein (TIGR00251 family)
MRISIRVMPGAAQQRIITKPDSLMRVYLTEKPLNGKANNALIEVLASYFMVSKSRVRIVNGFKSRNKVIEIVK